MAWNPRAYALSAMPRQYFESLEPSRPCTVTTAGESPRLPDCQWHTPAIWLSESTRNRRSSPTGSVNLRRTNADAIVCKCPLASQECGSNCGMDCSTVLPSFYGTFVAGENRTEPAPRHLDTKLASPEYC